MKRMQNVLFAAVAATLIFAAGNALAVTASGTVTLSTTLPSKASLTLGGNTTPAFDGTSVDAGTPISGGAPTTVTAKVRTGSAALPTLKVTAGTDFVGTTSTIPASDVSWTGTVDLVSGTLTTAPAGATVNGAWTGSNTYAGNMTWSLLNPASPAYQADTYANVTVTYTLTAP